MAQPNTGPTTPTLSESTTPLADKSDQYAPSIPHFPEKDGDSVEDGSSASETLIEEKSKGVVEMEYLAERINVKYLVLLYGGFMVLAYTLALSELFLFRHLPLR